MMPFFLKLKVRKENSRGVNLWLPVILVWILLLMIMVALFPLVFLVSVFTWKRGWGKMLILFYPVFFTLLFCLSGLRLDIDTGDEAIYLNFI